MAVELVATAFLTVTFEKLLERLSSEEFVNFFKERKSADELEALTVKLQTVCLLLLVAEIRQVVDTEVKEWLDKLKDEVFKVDDLFEEINAKLRSEHQQQPGCSMKSIFTSFTQFDKTVRSKITRFSKDLDILMNRADFLGLKHANPQYIRHPELTPIIPLRDESFVFGREDDKEKILKLLFADDDCDTIRVLPILGIGGIGKTTLAQLVYEDERVEGRFELKAWVNVSTDQLDVFKIMKTLLQQIGATSQSDEPRILQHEMKEALRSKRFLLVLDDVWDENCSNWDLLSNFMFADPRSKIIVTSRSRKVCQNVRTGPIHKLTTVSKDAGWKILVHHALDGDLNSYPRLHPIGKRIVDMCNGLPLAIKVVGGLLRSERNPKKWESISSSPVWEWSKCYRQNGAFPSLWLSYHYLPSTVKQCFAYCAIFPLDYVFKKEDMVLLWMVEGFLQPDINENLEEVGDKYFKVLISRFFFQRYDKVNSSYVMHHLVHDLATFVLSRDDGLLDLKKKFSTLSDLSYTSLNFHLESAWQIPDWLPKQLRTLILAKQSRWDVQGRSGDLVCKAITKFEFLRLLDLHNTGIKVVPSSIAGLKHLRYLDLSRNVNLKELPNSITSLWNLQTLKLNNCRNLRVLPRDISKLVNLRYLENDSCYSLTCMPQGLGKLSNLRTLSEFVLPKSTTSKRSGKLDELRNLNALSGRLKIKNLRCPDRDRTKAALLKDKERLRSLVLIWDIEAPTDHHEKSLEDLEPHQNLRELCLSSYRGVRFSSWLPSLRKLVQFMLLKCTKCQYLPALDCLPNLRVLRVDELTELTHVSEEEGQEFFPSLIELELKNLPKLEQWWKHPDNVKHKAFRSLSKLVIEDCPNLTSMPRFPGLDEQLVMQNTKWSPFQQTIAPSEASSSSSSSSSSLSKMRTLSIIDMPECDVAIWKSLPSLRALTLDHIPEIKPVLEALQCITGLKELNISRCDSLEEISGWIGNIKSLTSLSIRLCSNLKIPRNQISLITSLQRVKIENCPRLCHIEGMIKDRLYTI